MSSLRIHVGASNIVIKDRYILPGGATDTLQTATSAIKYHIIGPKTNVILLLLAGHPRSGCPARLRGHKGSGLWKVCERKTPQGRLQFAHSVVLLSRL